MASSQMLKGVLEGCVLALIGRGETYGYELVGTLAACGLTGIAEGTLYPLLMRLEKKGCIASVYRESDMGPRRKYYRITDEGTAEVARFAREFDRLSAVVDRVLQQGAAQAPGEGPGEADALTAEAIVPGSRVRGVLSGDFADVISAGAGSRASHAACEGEGAHYA